MFSYSTIVVQLLKATRAKRLFLLVALLGRSGTKHLTDSLVYAQGDIQRLFEVMGQKTNVFNFLFGV